MNEKKLKLNDLSLGMKISAEQLDDIYDTYFIIAYKDMTESDDKKCGELVYIGKEQTEEYEKWFEQKAPITPVYNRSTDLEDMVVYDE